MSSEELIDHITTFFLVGYETSSGVIHFTLWALARDLARQQKLREELLRFGREPTFDEIWNGEALPYLDAVVKEGYAVRSLPFELLFIFAFLTKNNRLRLFPSSAHTEKVVANDDVIPLRWPVRSPDGKHVLHEIPVTKGQVIHIPSRTVNRLARVWGSDAEEFVPERWLNPTRIPNSDDLTNGWSGLFSFSEGPRTCVGFRLGTFERGFVIIIHNN